MAYLMDASKCQIVTVTGSIKGQKIINRYHYAYPGVLPSPDVDVSSTFLTNFIAAYRATVLPVAYDDYSVVNYQVAEIKSAGLVPGPPTRYQTNMDPSKLDLVLGTGADVGTLASAGTTKLPVHEIMRCKFSVASRAPKRFRALYARLSLGWPTILLAPAAPEQWTAGTITTVGGAFNAFIALAVFGSTFAAGVGYNLCAWSPPYYVTVVFPPPGPGDVRDATRQFTAATIEPFVGTQITRRYFPLGGFRGV